MTLFSKVATLVNDANKAGVKLILKVKGLPYALLMVRYRHH